MGPRKGRLLRIEPLTHRGRNGKVYTRTPEVKDQIREALSHDNTDTLSRTAHEIRAAGARMQARGTAMAAERLEMAARAGNRDELSRLAQDLCCEFDTAAEFLRSRVA